MSLPVDAPSTAVGEAKISRPQVSQDRTAPAPRAKGIASRISAFMRKGMEEDTLRVLNRLVRPGDHVLEVTAGPHSYAHALTAARVETFHVDATRLASGDPVAEMLGAHGQKCSRSNIQCHKCVRDLTQDLGGEMQTSGRRSHGTRLTSKNRLVTRCVGFIAVPIEIRR